MTDFILPTIGSSGFFELKAPFDKYVTVTERYTCKGIRSLSEYLANNEDPKADVYTKYGLADSEFNSDIVVDMHIVSLQSEKGYWLYVPANYILKYPITNGIPYRTIAIGVSLPSLPVAIELGYVETSISNVIKDMLGVTPVIKTVETSRVALVTKEKHDLTTSARLLVSGGRVTDRARYNVLMVNYQSALDKIAALEKYIKEHFVK